MQYVCYSHEGDKFTDLQFNDNVGKKMAMRLEYGQKFIDSFSQLKEMVMGKNKVPTY